MSVRCSTKPLFIGGKKGKKKRGKIGPNDPCPCGSGQKMKKCCKTDKKSRFAKPPFTTWEQVSRNLAKGMGLDCHAWCVDRDGAVKDFSNEALLAHQKEMYRVSFGAAPHPKDYTGVVHRVPFSNMILNQRLEEFTKKYWLRRGKSVVF